MPRAGGPSVNYPALVAEELGLELTDVSCSAASTTSLVGAQQTLEGPVPAQFAALTEDTDYVTMGIGGNDEDFLAQLFTVCLQVRDTDPDGAPCRDAMNAGGSDVLVDALELIEGRVTSALVGIRDRSPDAEIVMVGYPQLVPEEGTVRPAAARRRRLRLRPRPDGRSWARHRGSGRRGGRRVRRRAGGQRGPRHLRRRGRLGQRRRLRPTGRPAMHPFAEEQAAVAELVVEALQE